MGDMTSQLAQFEFTKHLDDEAQMLSLGAELALFVSSGDWIGLSGSLGAGKSTLARAIIQALDANGSELDVPSPTFTLVQLYNELRVPVAHCDFYRLEDAAEIDELGLEDFADSHACIVEWPERFGDQLPGDRLMIAISGADLGRTVALTGLGRMADKLQRMSLVGNFVAASDYADAGRQFFQGDASARRYEKLGLADGKSCLLMDMPDVPDGLPIRNGKPYSAIAHIATRILSVLAVNNELCLRGLSAPQILTSDPDNGLALIEFMDGRTYYDLIKSGGHTSEFLSAAVSLLSDMATQNWPHSVTLPDDSTYDIPKFDLEAFLIETELLLDWFWPAAIGAPVDDQARATFLDNWADLYRHVENTETVWMLRDFHSPNLIWLPARVGNSRVGLVDTQDTVLGHAAYDLVSMLQDARIDISADTETELLNFYCSRRVMAAEQTAVAFDEVGFRAAYAVLGAQRATKVLGIFVRLAQRDGKTGYLKHIDRVSHALERNLAHPVLAELRAWYGSNLPQNIRKRLGTGD